MTEMLVPAAYAQFTDPTVRQRVLQWHEEGMPFLDMAAQLGIVFDGPMRDVIANLSPDAVSIIRQAMIVAITNGGQSTNVTMPIDCTLDVVPPAVVVTAEQVDGQPWARVTAAKGAS